MRSFYLSLNHHIVLNILTHSLQQQPIICKLQSGMNLSIYANYRRSY